MKPINYPELTLALSTIGTLRHLTKNCWVESEWWEALSAYMFVSSIGAIIMGLIFL